VISCCFQVRIARIFNTYGPRMCIDDGRVVSNFVAQVNNMYTAVYLSYRTQKMTTKNLLRAVMVAGTEEGALDGLW
jgi:nucleoside-diphosphate-sugar epimerase